jgi:3',5'-nucleoside bisphosphate phosphatase
VFDITTIGGGLRLGANDAVDLHLHTHASDGAWTPEGLVDHLAGRGFRVAAVCDHDTQRSVAEAIRLGAERGMLVIPGVEITSGWRGRQLHILVYGIHPDRTDDGSAEFRAVLRDLDDELMTRAEDARKRLEATNRPIPNVGELHGDRPMWPYHVLMAAIKQEHVKNLKEAAELVVELGGGFSAEQPVERVVAAARQAGGVCVVAHPGRADAVGIVSEADFDALADEAPMQGIEAHYRSYTDAQTAHYRAEAARREMLITCGSDSHAPGQPVDPRPWRAAWCSDFLARFGVSVERTGDPAWAEGMDPDAVQPKDPESPETPVEQMADAVKPAGHP